MGAGGVPNCGVEISYERRLPQTHKPNSKIDRYRDGKRVQSRWYGEDGKAERNRDYSHGGDYPFPHDHDWTWNGENGNRGEEHLPPDYDGFPD